MTMTTGKTPKTMQPGKNPPAKKGGKGSKAPKLPYRGERTATHVKKTGRGR